MVVTDHVQAIITTHPQTIREPKQEAMIEAIQACIDCSQTCTTCSDACLAEKNPDMLRASIRSTADCADICAATAKVLSRLTEPRFDVLRDLVKACITSVQVTGKECSKHAQHHEHCALCAQSCTTCEEALSRYHQFIK